MRVHHAYSVLHDLSLSCTLQIVPVCALLTPTVDNKFKKIAIGCLAAVMFVQVCYGIPCYVCARFVLHNLNLMYVFIVSFEGFENLNIRRVAC